LRHRMAVARNEDCRTNADARGLLGDARQSDPDIMTERWDLGAPDALIAKLLCCHGVGDCIRTRRKTKRVGEHIRSLLVLSGPPRHGAARLPNWVAYRTWGRALVARACVDDARGGSYTL